MSRANLWARTSSLAIPDALLHAVTLICIELTWLNCVFSFFLAPFSLAGSRRQALGWHYGCLNDSWAKVVLYRLTAKLGVSYGAPMERGLELNWPMIGTEVLLE